MAENSPAFQKRKEAALQRAREAAERRKQNAANPDPILGVRKVTTVKPKLQKDPDLPLSTFDYKFAPKKCTPELLERFLNYFRETGIVSTACKAVGICPSTIHRLRHTNVKFAEVYDLARAEAVDRLEEEARRRAFEGVEKPVFYKGEECGVIREYSDKLLEFLLTFNNPAKFGGNSKHVDPAGGGAAPVQVIIQNFSDGTKQPAKQEVIVIDPTAGTKQDHPTVQVETPRLSDAGVELHGERREAGGDSLA